MRISPMQYLMWGAKSQTPMLRIYAANCVATKEAVSLLCSNPNKQLRIVIKFIMKKKNLHENANAFSEKFLT